MKHRVGNGSSKYDYEPEKIDPDIATTCKKVSEFKQSVINLIKSSDLNLDTRKWLIIEAMEELNMIEVSK